MFPTNVMLFKCPEYVQAVEVKELPGMAAKKKQKAKLLSADASERRDQLVAAAERLSVRACCDCLTPKKVFWQLKSLPV